MPFEEIVKELEKQDAVIDKAQQTKKELYQKLLDADTDLITVQYASKLLSVSVATIYNKINNGELTCKNIGSSKRVLKSEVLAINDR